jgi:hypothetical protein
MLSVVAAENSISLISCFAATEYLGSFSNSQSNKLLILILGLEQLDF